jgi:hypothetical protein
MFGKDQIIPLSPIDGWLFRKGNDTSWAAKQLNTSDWIKLKPTELSAKMQTSREKPRGGLGLNLDWTAILLICPSVSDEAAGQPQIFIWMEI